MVLSDDDGRVCSLSDDDDDCSPFDDFVDVVVCWDIVTVTVTDVVSADDDDPFLLEACVDDDDDFDDDELEACCELDDDVFDDEVELLAFRFFEVCFVVLCGYVLESSSLARA